MDGVSAINPRANDDQTTLGLPDYEILLFCFWYNPRKSAIEFFIRHQIVRTSRRNGVIMQHCHVPQF